MRLTGLHHLTAIVRDLDRTTAFYRDLLGLRLVREGASDDDPGARHFWFALGDGAGPGHLLSFLEYPTMPAAATGTGAVQHFAGYRSHSALLAAIAGFGVVVPLWWTPLPQEALLVTFVLVAVLAFRALRAAFARRSGGLTWRA